MARYVPPYLLDELWRDRSLHASSAIVLRNGAVELDVPAGRDVVVAGYRDLTRLAKAQRIRPMPSWDGFVKLAIVLSLQTPELDESYPDSDMDVATAAQAFRHAENELITAVRAAHQHGSSVSALATATLCRASRLLPMWTAMVSDCADQRLPVTVAVRVFVVSSNVWLVAARKVLSTGTPDSSPRLIG